MAPLVERVLGRMDAGGCLDATAITLDMVLETDRLARTYAVEEAGRDDAPWMPA
jgi:hypothetical protein